MNFEITQVTERLVNGEIGSVQVHYKLASPDHQSGHNGFITLDKREDDLERVVKDKLIEQVNQLSVE